MVRTKLNLDSEVVSQDMASQTDIDVNDLFPRFKVPEGTPTVTLEEILAARTNCEANPVGA